MTEEERRHREEDITVCDLYRENWAHVRHVENERMGFTSIYFLIVAGVLAFWSNKGFEGFFSIILLLLLILISTIGMLLSYRLKADMEAHGEKLRQIAENYHLSEYHTFGAEKGPTTRFKLRKLFPLMYLVMTIAFSLLFFYELTKVVFACRYHFIR